MRNKKIFEQIPDDIDESWYHGALIGAMAERTEFELATSFKLAGDLLIESVIDKQSEAYELIYPIIFNYRHSIELYLKSLVKHDFKHDLSSLLLKLQAKTVEKYKQKLPDWFSNLIIEIDDFDKKGTTFRYSDQDVISFSTNEGGEFWVDLIRLKAKMENLETGFKWLKINER